MIRRVPAFVLGIVAAVAVAGCMGGPPLTVENLTDTPVGVYVNGNWVGTDEPGATITTRLGTTAASSYLVEARSPSGAVLAAFEAPVAAAVAADEGEAPLGQAFGVPCGEIRILIGELGPNEALAPAPSVQAGPCP